MSITDSFHFYLFIIVILWMAFVFHSVEYYLFNLIFPFNLFTSSGYFPFCWCILPSCPDAHHSCFPCSVSFHLGTDSQIWFSLTGLDHKVLAVIGLGCLIWHNLLISLETNSVTYWGHLNFLPVFNLSCLANTSWYLAIYCQYIFLEPSSMDVHSPGV